jgi:hypothetical protein
MWRYWLRWAIIVAGILLGGLYEWYESEHQPHAGDYRSWIPMLALVGIGLIDLITRGQETVQHKGRFSGSDFRDDYIRLLTDAIEAIQDVKEYDESLIRQVQKKILKLISAVVVLFHPEAERLGINANLMEEDGVEVHATADRFRDHVHFVDPQRAASSYAGVLCIKVWAESPQVVPLDFALPLDRDKERILFGAPRTYKTGEELVIENIHRAKDIGRLLQGQPPVVARATQGFFQAQRYKTFISIPVLYSDNVIAVLNIQADKEGVFGRRTSHAAEMKKFIDPFCTVLGILTAQTRAHR